MTQGPLSVSLANSSATGRSWFVNEATGKDSNSGSSVAPFATLTQALTAARPNQNDVVYLIGSVHVSATVAWNVSGVSLVGLSAPSQNDRARISQTGSTVFSPLVNVTASGCSFVNLATFHGFDSNTAQVCWNEGGGRNYYSCVQFLGGGNATAAAHAGMRSLLVTGANGENRFEDCTIGLDTVTRATGTNASLEFTSGTPRNLFRRCTFQALCSNAADLHVLIGADGIDRWVAFDQCMFFNAIGSGATSLTAALSVNASSGGVVLVNFSGSVGATKLASANVFVNGGPPTAATSALAVAST